MNRRFQNQRHSIRLEKFDYASNGAYFVTICTNTRDTAWFGTVTRDGTQINAAGEMVRSELEGLTERFANLELNIFIVMPDHVHAIWVLRTAHDVSQPHTRRGEPRVRPLTAQPPNVNHRLFTNAIDGPRIAQGEHKVRPYEHPDGTTQGSIGRVMQAFKSITTHRYIRGVRELGWPPFEKRLWQRDDWERVIRDDRELEVKRSYVLENPARWLEARGGL